jgi:hypothetical protein
MPLSYSTVVYAMYALEKEESQQVAPDCLDLATLQDAKL